MAEETLSKHIQRAQHLVRSVLNNIKHGIDEASSISHSYANKFGLAECMTKLANAAYTDLFVSLGLDIATVRPKLRDWFNNGVSITLRFESHEYCEFLREEERILESAKHTTKTGVFSVERSTLSTTKHFIYEVREPHLTCATWFVMLGSYSVQRVFMILDKCSA